MTGYSLEEVEGKNCRFLQNGETDQPGLTLVREAISQQRETVAVLKNYRKDGRLFWNELALSPIRNRDGELTHVVGIQMDVTERVELETALRESEKLAAVGRLASAISHEINNPLEAVMNLVYLMNQQLPEGPANQEVRDYIRQADEELKRMKLITSQALRFSKQSHGPEAVTCEELLTPILEIYGPRFKNYNVKVELRNRTEQHVVCMMSEIRQVLTNLITNAVHAMHAQGGRLLIRTRESTHPRDERRGITITIADTGAGMSPSTVANIYKAFYTTKGLQGTGLGLWISAEIVGRHRGHLRVRSSQRPDHSGTTFPIKLPPEMTPSRRFDPNQSLPTKKRRDPKGCASFLPTTYFWSTSFPLMSRTSTGPRSAAFNCGSIFARSPAATMISWSGCTSSVATRCTSAAVTASYFAGSVA
jgi:two-component system sporulation sensor kinase C